MALSLMLPQHEPQATADLGRHPTPVPTGRCLLDGAHPGHQQRRHQMAHGLGGDGDGGPQQLHERAAERGPGEPGDGVGALQPGVALDEVGPAHHGRDVRLVGDFVEGGGEADRQGRRHQPGEVDPVQGEPDDEARQEERAQQVAGDEDRPAAHPVEGGGGQRRRGQERQRHPAHVGADGAGRLGGPEEAEVPVLEQ
nr:hypothetical protein [Streptomyces sp. NRRL S-481]